MIGTGCFAMIQGDNTSSSKIVFVCVCVCVFSRLLTVSVTSFGPVYFYTGQMHHFLRSLVLNKDYNFVA